MKRIAIFIVLFSLVYNVWAQTDQELTTKTEVGQMAPDFTFTSLDGKTYKLSDFKGKTVMLNFFATWCGPCMKELPQVEKDIWSTYKNDNFVVLSFGREHSIDEMKKFVDKKGFTFMISPDPERKFYSLYAEKYIPRNFLINKEGKIIFQCVGFAEEDFKEIMTLIAEEVK